MQCSKIMKHLTYVSLTCAKAPVEDDHRFRRGRLPDTSALPSRHRQSVGLHPRSNERLPTKHVGRMRICSTYWPPETRRRRELRAALHGAPTYRLAHSLRPMAP